MQRCCAAVGALVAVVWILACGCGGPVDSGVEMARFPVGNVVDTITREHVTADAAITSDGNGALRIEVAAPTTVRLYETGDIDVENARLTYRAMLRTDAVEGKVYLEMWSVFEGKGEFFSRGLQSPLSGTHDWTLVETPFFFKAGENPDAVRLNLVIDGSGTVWIDDIRLVAAPLR